MPSPTIIEAGVMAGDDQTTPAPAARHFSAPVIASTACTNCPSEVPVYRMPSTTDDDEFTHETL
jgi:hypothetical protein